LTVRTNVWQILRLRGSESLVCNRDLMLDDYALEFLVGKLPHVEDADAVVLPASCASRRVEPSNYGRACCTLRIDGRDVGDILIADGLAIPSGRHRQTRASGKSPARTKRASRPGEMSSMTISSLSPSKVTSAWPASSA
jgi:hypothetical protein